MDQSIINNPNQVQFSLNLEERDTNIAPERFTEFFKKYDSIQGIDDPDYDIEIVYLNGVLVPQYWKLSFKGERLYSGKKISGVLKFNKFHPRKPPTFYFDLLKEGITIQHENIYQGGLLCLPLLSELSWREQTLDYEIIRAIKHVFNNPNVNDPANKQFTQLPQNEKQKIIQRQAQQLPNWNDDSQ